MQFAYFDEPELDAMGPQVPLPGLSALVDPPHYQIYLDGKTVIAVRHDVTTFFGGPGFAIFWRRHRYGPAEQRQGLQPALIH